jgi:CBS domain-containing protein
MTRDPACCLPESRLDAVARMMVHRDCGAIPVIGDLTTRHPIGVVTDRDIVTRTLAGGRDPMAMIAADCMSSPVATIPEDASIRDCVHLLETSRIRRAVVVDSFGRVIGMISQGDIATHASKWRTGDLVREVSQPAEPAFTH